MASSITKSSILLRSRLCSFSRLRPNYGSSFARGVMRNHRRYPIAGYFCGTLTLCGFGLLSFKNFPNSASLLSVKCDVHTNEDILLDQPNDHYSTWTAIDLLRIIWPEATHLLLAVCVSFLVYFFLHYRDQLADRFHCCCDECLYPTLPRRIREHHF